MNLAIRPPPPSGLPLGMTVPGMYGEPIGLGLSTHRKDQQAGQLPCHESSPPKETPTPFAATVHPPSARGAGAPGCRCGAQRSHLEQGGPPPPPQNPGPPSPSQPAALCGPCRASGGASRARWEGDGRRVRGQAPPPACRSTWPFPSAGFQLHPASAQCLEARCKHITDRGSYQVE